MMKLKKSELKKIIRIQLEEFMMGNKSQYGKAYGHKINKTTYSIYGERVRLKNT